jgi:hypothetical protein
VIATVFGGVEVAEEHLPPKEHRLFVEEETGPAAATHSEAEKLVGPESTHFTPVRRSFADGTSPIPMLAASSTAGPSANDAGLTELIANIDTMTVAELKKALTKYNIAFDSKAKRATLVKQLQQLSNGVEKKQPEVKPKAASGRKRSREDEESEPTKKSADNTSPKGKKALALPTEENTVAEIKAYAAANGIDISKAKKKQQMLKLLGSK